MQNERPYNPAVPQGLDVNPRPTSPPNQQPQPVGPQITPMQPTSDLPQPPGESSLKSIIITTLIALFTLILGAGLAWMIRGQQIVSVEKQLTAAKKAAEKKVPYYGGGSVQKPTKTATHSQLKYSVVYPEDWIAKEVDSGTDYKTLEITTADFQVLASTQLCPQYNKGAIFSIAAGKKEANTENVVDTVFKNAKDPALSALVVSPERIKVANLDAARYFRSPGECGHSLTTSFENNGVTYTISYPELNAGYDYGEISTYYKLVDSFKFN